MDKNQLEFPVCIYGKLEPVNDVLSRARVRIFYKYANRNGTYITDEFADELVKTLPGVPVKGIYDGDDYTDHGDKRSDGQVYGFVPEENHFAWEPHVDIDEVERIYACCDVLLFTALYPEASKIVGKGQSMELYAPTLKYHYSFIKGKKYVVFEHGSFLGLQVLGDNVEPCFEGASFYTLQKQIQDTIQKIKEFSNIGGKTGMPQLNFRLSNDAVYDALWQLLNPNCDEEHDYEVSYVICDVYGDYHYAVVRNLSDRIFERVFYIKNDEEDSIQISGKEQCFIVDINEKEKETLDALRLLNGDTYEAVSEVLTQAQSNADKCVELNTKIDELNNNIVTLTTEKETAQAAVENITDQYSQLQTQFNEVSNERDSLKTYKQNVELHQKQDVLAEYDNQLNNEILQNYRDSIDNYTVEELDMHLAYEVKKSGSPNTPRPSFVPKDEELNGVNAILARYKK